MCKSNSNGQPFWFKPETIHHELDTDIIASMRRGNEKCSTLMMMDPSFDAAKNIYHIEWTSEDCSKLVEGMFYRSLEVLRFSDPDNELYQEELAWQRSPQFSEICKLLGYDAGIIRAEVKKIMKRYGKGVEHNMFAEFSEYSEIFAELFRKSIGVKVVSQGLYNILLQHCEKDFELSSMLTHLGELMDDLHLAGVSRNVCLDLLVNKINK